MKRTIGIRADIDFEIGITKGVPYLLDFFKQNDIKATFFVTMGPDGFANNKKRLNSTNYLKRILSFNPLNIIFKFGFSYLARQFLGCSGNVGADHPEVLNRIIKEGHELGLHGYDHFWWAENIWDSDLSSVKKDMNKALSAFKNITGTKAKIWSSPNWRCSKNSLKLVDEFDFLYGADCRGKSPFFPVINGWKGKKIQVPITLPCLHEAKQFLGTDDRKTIIKYFLSQTNDTYNVLCLHGYYEGILERELFVALVKELKCRAFELVPLKALYEEVDKNNVQPCELIKRRLPGGRGDVSFQGGRAKE